MFTTARSGGPVGQLVATFEQLHAAGCIQTLADVHEDVKVAKEHGNRMFVALMAVTNDNPCSGCPAYCNGICPAFKAHFVGPSQHKWPSRPAPKPAAVRERCPKCKLKIRGENHEAHCTARE